MTDRVVEIVLKVVIVLGVIGLLGMFLPEILIMTLNLSIADKIYFKIVYGSMAIMGISGVLIIIISLVGGKIESKPVKAEKFKMNINEFDELKAFLEESLIQTEYTKKKEVVKNEQSTVTLYARNNRTGWLECFSLIRVDEWTNEIEEIIDNELEKLVEQYCNEGKRYRKISMIIVICVNRITPAFQKLVNGNIQQGLNQFRLPVGISFGGKQIYVAKQKDGFAIMQYKRLRKEFLDIMGIEEK